MIYPTDRPRQTLADRLEEEIELSRLRLEADLPPGPPDPNHVGPILRERSLAKTKRIAKIGRRMVDEFAAEQPASEPLYPKLTD